MRNASYGTRVSQLGMGRQTNEHLERMIPIGSVGRIIFSIYSPCLKSIRLTLPPRELLRVAPCIAWCQGHAVRLNGCEIICLHTCPPLGGLYKEAYNPGPRKSDNGEHHLCGNSLCLSILG